MAAEEKPHYLGHRERLRERLLERGGDSLADHEVLELLLFGAKPRGDTKPLAKALIKRFGSVAAVFGASPKELAAVAGSGPACAALIKAVREAALRMSQQELARSDDVLSSSDQLLAYCRTRLAHESIEHFHLLFLDRKNRLIADEVQQTGTIDHTPVYPREVVKRALELHASALILVHNHPSGDPTPSQGDIAMTREIAEAASKLGIVVHDHVVIGREGHSSFRSLGLL